MPKNNKYIIIGASAFVSGLLIFLSTFLPILKNETSYQVSKIIPNHQKEIQPVDREFSIVIPKINANSKIVQDVDPFNSSIYQKALTKGVAHAKGTGLPGQPGNMFLFSHSSSDFLTARKYNSVFYLLSKLSQGDIIQIYYQDNIYNYQVIGSKKVKADDLSILSSRNDQEVLTMMTCWPPGTSLKRLVVQAKRLP